MGMWMSLHHALVDLKTQSETLRSSLSFEGLLCTVGVLHDHQRPTGSSFSSFAVSCMLLHSCARVKGFVVGNISFFCVLLEHGESDFLTLLVA